MSGEGLRAYAARMLADTGVTADQVPSLTAADADGSAAAEALRAGWHVATAPIPDLPIDPLAEQEQ